MQSVTTFVKRPIFIITFVIGFLLIIAYSFEGSTKSVSQGSTVNKNTLGLPVRLTIPVINVNAAIQHLGVTANGEMEVPNSSIDVGWFKLGSRPGENGSAVIVGHVDDPNGKAGIFMNLYQLKKGDTLYIEDDTGRTLSFVVRESRLYDPGYAEEVFSANDKAHLNLITCDGVWDGTKKSYTKRLVVFADAN
jgi:LPXTG-site transpeptidase (sortase) family protein